MVGGAGNFEEERGELNTFIVGPVARDQFPGPHLVLSDLVLSEVLAVDYSSPGVDFSLESQRHGVFVSAASLDEFMIAQSFEL